MQEVKYIQKESKRGMRYSIVSHDAVTAKVRPSMVSHGIIYYPVNMATSQDGNRTVCEMTVRFQSVDNPESFIDVPSFGYGIDDQDKGPGKAISYAVKYALLKTLGLETGDDPDYDQEVQHKAEAAPLPVLKVLDENGDPTEMGKKVIEAIEFGKRTVAQIVERNSINEAEILFLSQYENDTDMPSFL
jgi:hypothetical protein